MTDHITIEEKKPATSSSSLGKIGIFFSTFAMVIFICAFGYGYFELSKVNLTLAHKVSSLQDRAISTEKNLVTLQQTIQNLQQNAQKSQALSNEQEKLVSEWQAAQKGSLEKWQVAEAQYLVRLANDHLQFTYHFPVAIALLQRADQILQTLQNANLEGIRKSIATETAGLQTVPQVDLTALYARLNVLDKTLDRLPLPPTPLKSEKEEVPVPENLSWWKTGMAYSWQALKKIVIVRNTADNPLPLVLPEEKIFLYQNVHAQMEAAMWGVLHRNADVYQASLMRVQTWVQQYFDQDAQTTKTVLQTIGDLQKINIQPPTVNLSVTLQLFDDYFSKANKAP